jgi:hypothetical protein
MTRSLTEINADIKANSASANAINAINKAVALIGVLIAALGIWALGQAEAHYEAQDKINQEQIAWNR